MVSYKRRFRNWGQFLGWFRAQQCQWRVRLYPFLCSPILSISACCFLMVSKWPLSLIVREEHISYYTFRTKKTVLQDQVIYGVVVCRKIKWSWQLQYNKWHWHKEHSYVCPKFASHVWRMLFSCLIDNISTKYIK